MFGIDVLYMAQAIYSKRQKAVYSIISFVFFIFKVVEVTVLATAAALCVCQIFVVTLSNADWIN